MANYFTHFSFIVPLTSKDQQAYALNLHQQMIAIQQGGEVPEGFPPGLIDVCEDCFYEVAPRSRSEIWLQSMDGGVDAACAFVQHLLARFQPDNCVTFQWSHDCSEPRVGAYGGGAAIITAREIKTFNTADWLREHTPLPEPQPERKP